MLNHITLMGRLVRDPELRYTGNSVPVANFTVAVDRDYQSEGGERQADFIDCCAWRGTAEFISEYFHKGNMIAVSGRLQSRKWEDQDGNKRTGWEVKADSVYFCERKKPDSNSSHSVPADYSRPADYSPAAYSYTPSFQDLDYEDNEHPF